jgi:hypothetical protein
LAPALPKANSFSGIQSTGLNEFDVSGPRKINERWVVDEACFNLAFFHRKHHLSVSVKIGSNSTRS